MSANLFVFVRNSSFLFVVPSWAKAPSSGNSSPPVSSENSPRPERTEVFENRTVEPEDMSKDRVLHTIPFADWIQCSSVWTVRWTLIKDRTNEFLTICRSIGTSPQVQGNSRLRQKSAFTKKCKLVGADITKTWGKLERLTQLCKSTTLFNDKPVEIQELTYIIKQEMDEMRWIQSFCFWNLIFLIKKTSSWIGKSTSKYWTSKRPRKAR